MPGNQTPLPATQDTTSTQRARASSKPEADVDYQSIQMLADSYSLALRYGDEYMDQNPIIGEPGSFRLAKSHDSMLSASMTTSKSSQPPSSLRNETPAPHPERSPSPRSKAEDPKAPEISPFTVAPPVKDKKDKKERKKSKAAGAMEPMNPIAALAKIESPN